MAEYEKVVLADLDVEEPNSGLFLDGKLDHKEEKFTMVPKWDSRDCTHCGKCQEVCNFNAVLKMGDMIMVFPELCHACYACSELCPAGSLPMIPKKMGDLKSFSAGDLRFIESKLLVGVEQAVPLIAQTIQYLDENFPEDSIEIIDAPPGTSCPVIEVVRESDLVLLVTEPTPFGLHDLKLAVDTVRKLNKPFAVVINRYGIGDNKVEKYCKDENIEIIALIPNDRKIAEIYSRGKLLYPVMPEVKEAIAKIAAYIKKAGQGNK